MNIIRRMFDRIGSRGRRAPESAGISGVGDLTGAGAPAGGSAVCVEASRAATVRAIAGAPIGQASGVAGGSRRGTVLIIVLGTLALIAVIAVVYAVVGRADRRASAAFVGSVKREEMPALVRDYIADIVGRDALATYRDGSGDLRRESFDYPFTDPVVVSVPVGQPGVANMGSVPASDRQYRQFNPEGTFSLAVTSDYSPAQVAGLGSLGNPNALLVPSDPWLGSTQASNLRLDDDEADNGFQQFNMRDWANLTNVSPDGRFVNLWNLRNNFGAASGFAVGPKEVSSRLTLYGPTGLPILATQPQIRDDGSTASPNRPAHWTSRQRGAFRPATGLPGIGWSEAEFPAYQWADADGDGFFDSRWFEFVDISAGVDAARNIFPGDATFRWFGAVRIVDLSAAVNINIATDFLARPGSATSNYDAPGGTPADIDLRRLLTGEDTRELAGGIAYDALRPPLLPGTTTIDPNSAQFTGLIDQYGPASGAEFIGDAAYNNARYFLEFGLVTPPNIRIAPPQAASFLGYLSSQHGYVSTSTALLRQQTITARREWFELVTGSVLGGDLSVSVFGLDSESELLTFRGANDPLFASTLELVADGRFDNGAGNNAAMTSLRYGPFRSTRQSLVELADRDRSTGLGNPGAVGPVAADGVADLDAMTQVLVDIRQYITTLSASRPLRNTPISTASPVPALSATDVPRTLSSVTSNTKSLFSLYADALLPYSGFLESWLPAADPIGGSYRTLSYGYAGSEVAIHHAAHMAVNMADAIDSDSTPRVATVLVDERLRNALNADYDPPPPSGQNPTGPTFVKPMGPGGAGRSHPWAAWVDSSNSNFDLGKSRIADSSAGSAPISPAFNVYGLEAQPFIAEVSAIALYVDAPAGTGGTAIAEPDFGNITIDGAQDAGNADLAFQAIAFQITNPFGVPINLSGDTASQESRFYIEFGGRYYRFPSMDPGQPGWTGTLGAHETRVFYAPARPRSDTEARWNQIEAGTGGRLTAFVNHIMGVNATGVGGRVAGPVQLAEFTPETGANEAFGPGVFVNRLGPKDVSSPSNAINEVRLWRTYLATGTTQGGAGSPAEAYTQNATQNDILADRFRDPEALSGNPETLGAMLDLSPMDEVNNARKIPQSPGETETDYDTGLTVMLWGTVRRPSDPDARAAASADEVVWMPAYCLEPKFSATLNTVKDEGVNRGSLDANDFDAGSRVELALSFSSFLDTAVGATFVDTLVLDARVKDHSDIGPNMQGESWDGLRTEFYQNVGDNNAPGTRGLRPFDMLLASAIGPTLELDATLSPPTLNSWTTLGEATMLALDYDQGTQGTHVLWHPARPALPAGGTNRGSVDNGHILFDQFVPFYDATPNGQPFDPASDIVYGDGQPLALGIVGAFRAFDDRFGTFRRGTPGLININTAPLAVLRTLPMLSPTTGSDPTSASPTPGTAWWGANTGQTIESDAASTLAAYRDRTIVFARADGAGNNQQIDFEAGRRFTTGIAGIREVPGFRSIGEVLTARDENIRLTITPGVAGLHDMDRLGLDGDPQTMLGFDPSVVPGAGSGIDSLTDEFDERLVLANSISNMVTVRSDVYAVWFVLHGYRESDCSGLAIDDPLIPSVSRRFLMILDRSNVVAPGDKPAILLFREVPYSPTTAGDGSAI